jgi:pyruvate dehydrogenase E2 component (dihydrolipoamide acetyltransferase)
VGEETPKFTQAAPNTLTPSPLPLSTEAGERGSFFSDADHLKRPITPRARRIAKELGVECRKVQGTGRNGRIRERDVRAVAKQSGDRAIAVSTHRKVIAQRLGAGLREAIPVTLTTTADATNLVALREQFRASRSADEAIPSYDDIIVKLAAGALQRHTMLNSRWENERIVVVAGIHIGIAVDTEAGLVVPVVRDVPNLGLRQLAARSLDLIERARSRRLTKDEMRGGTFTVTNLGSFGIDAFTPVINPPECAVLGIGAIRREPAVVADQVVPRDRLTLSLTFDHRIVDGAPAARFLADLRGAIENPAASLVG